MPDFVYLVVFTKMFAKESNLGPSCCEVRTLTTLSSLIICIIIICCLMAIMLLYYFSIHKNCIIPHVENMSHIQLNFIVPLFVLILPDGV